MKGRKGEENFKYILREGRGEENNKYILREGRGRRIVSIY